MPIFGYLLAVPRHIVKKYLQLLDRSFEAGSTAEETRPIIIQTVGVSGARQRIIRERKLTSSHSLSLGLTSTLALASASNTSTMLLRSSMR